ncbi:carbon-nitrogen hydrolase family protein [Novosphingobium sp. SG707]|uniref:carbon-nitrogen hydrolase family protein n=1 Tax=Novosphingobium sp. SG707 TaxID=2586996 RepID=UPI001447FC5A|nr:carbon-nitrogen hydrolase family protein [Novosphingobium sp. SG707]NKJ00713.1 putative amidohydrolase [Novosphingobium sp. SG707]
MTASFPAAPFLAAIAQYPIDELSDWAAYEAKLRCWVGEAAGQGAAGRGAALLVFPEYGAMELAALDRKGKSDLDASLGAVSDLLPRVDALHGELARAHGVYILAASAPCRVGDHYVNRARFFAPSGAMSHQDKIMMTRFEAEQWGVSPAGAIGGGLRLFDTALGRIGITICYDSEFPLLTRALAQAGADIILAPSCTDSLHGYWRVRIGAQARALENQCFVLQSPTVGDAPWSPAVDVNRGAAGLYGPPDAKPAAGADMPADGVLALGEEGAAQWVYASVDPARVAAWRGDGSILTHRDWAVQPGAGVLPEVEVVVLR